MSRSKDAPFTEAPEIPVIAAGEGWLVVDKPCGISVHNDPGRDLCSIVGRAAGPVPRKLHPVNRLDRETSGVMILCSDPAAFRFMAAQFESGSVAKRYVALLHGRLEPAHEATGASYWDWPLADDGGGRRFPQGRGVPRVCRTRWRVGGFSRHFTRVDCEPESGRRHQIRRHAALAGHPVVGDRRYGSPGALAVVRRRFGFARLALHAVALSVVPPGERQAVEFCSGGIPAQIERLFGEDV